MKKRRIVPSLLMVVSLLLGGYVFWQFQSQLTAPAGAQREAEVIGSDSDYQPHWRNPTPVEHREAVSTIMGQLNDFKRGDFTHSLTYQSRESLQRLTPMDMRRMILNDYPAFATFKSVKLTYGQCDALGENFHILVALTASDGSVVEAVYFLQWEVGEFRIVGVQGARPELNIFSRFSPTPVPAPRAGAAVGNHK